MRARIPADIEQILNYLGLELFKIVHQDNELQTIYTSIRAASREFREGSPPCSVALYLYQALSSSMSYAANDMVAFRLALPNPSNEINAGSPCL